MPRRNSPTFGPRPLNGVLIALIIPFRLPTTNRVTINWGDGAGRLD